MHLKAIFNMYIILAEIFFKYKEENSAGNFIKECSVVEPKRTCVKMKDCFRSLHVHSLLFQSKQIYVSF